MSSRGRKRVCVIGAPGKLGRYMVRRHALDRGCEVVGVLRPDLVAEEPRRMCGAVGDRRLGFGQFLLEFFPWERPDLRLDLLDFARGTGDPSRKSSQ